MCSGLAPAHITVKGAGFRDGAHVHVFAGEVLLGRDPATEPPLGAGTTARAVQRLFL